MYPRLLLWHIWRKDERPINANTILHTQNDWEICKYLPCTCPNPFKPGVCLGKRGLERISVPKLLWRGGKRKQENLKWEGKLWYQMRRNTLLPLHQLRQQWYEREPAGLFMCAFSVCLWGSVQQSTVFWHCISQKSLCISKHEICPVLKSISHGLVPLKEIQFIKQVSHLNSLHQNSVVCYE